MATPAPQDKFKENSYINPIYNPNAKGPTKETGSLKIQENEEKAVSNWTNIKNWFSDNKKGIFIGFLITGLAISTIGVGISIAGATGSLQVGVAVGQYIVTHTTTHGFLQFAGLVTAIPGFGLTGFASGALSQME